jgi:hypothetical protein
MRSEATQSVMMSPGYTFGLVCERCGARRSDGSLRWCSACNSSCTVEAATSPWWTEPDGVLARVRGDADVVREIVSLKGL